MQEEHYLFIGILLLGIIFCVLVYNWLFTPRKSTVARKSLKRLKKVQDSISYQENQRILQLKLNIAEFFGGIPLISFTEEDKTELTNLIQSTDKRNKAGRLLLPEEIYCIQLLIAGIIALVCLLCMFLSPFAICGILVIPFMMRLPVKQLQAERKTYATALADEFLSFYKLYYVQFRQPGNTTTLSHVINSYMPSASLDVRKILKVVDGDLVKGEEYALKRFDLRFPDSPKVHKFCAVARARMKGDAASFDAMRSFLQYLQDEHDVYFEKERIKREKRLTTVVNTYLFIGLAIVCFMTFAMMFMIN